MDNHFEKLPKLAADCEKSWATTVKFLESLSFDWTTEHPSLCMPLAEFDAKFNAALSLVSPPKKNASKALLSALSLSPEFKMVNDSLVNIKSQADAINGFFIKAKESGQGVRFIDLNRADNPTAGQINYGQSLKEIRSGAGSFISKFALFKDLVLSGRVSDLADRIEKFRDLSEEVVTINKKIKPLLANAESWNVSIEEKLSSSKQILEEIEETHVTAKEVLDHSESARNLITEKVGLIEEIKTRAESLKESVISYQEEFDAFEEDLSKKNTKMEEFETLTSKVLEENEDRGNEIDALLQKADGMLQGATNAGLAKAFNDAAEKYGSEAIDAKKAFYWAIAFLIGSALPLALYVFKIPGIDGTAMEINSGVTLGGVIARGVLLLPTVWLTSFTAHRHSSLFQLHREYSFKAAIAMSVDGFQRQAPQFKEEIAGTAFVGLAEKPDYHSNKVTPKSPNPVLNYLVKILQKRFDTISGNGE